MNVASSYPCCVVGPKRNCFAKRFQLHHEIRFISIATVEANIVSETNIVTTRIQKARSLDFVSSLFQYFYYYLYQRMPSEKYGVAFVGFIKERPGPLRQ
jgi:hypothetical protein